VWLNKNLSSQVSAMSPIVKEQEVLTATSETATAARPVAASESAAKAQPVALETSVTVNGARTIEGSDKREPFSESTKTVLVLGTGAVIRLSSSVAPGQLLFLTNDKTKKEVVCQVVKSKNFRNVSGYVELEFTEPAVGFWGMRFPTDRIGSQPATSSQTSLSTPTVAVAPPPAAAQKVSEVKPPVPVAVVPPVAAKPLENKIPAPVSAPRLVAPVSATPSSANGSASPANPVATSYSSTTSSSTSPNSSVFSLPRTLEVKPSAVAPKPSTPVVLAPLLHAELNVTPMGRASDQKKPAVPVTE